jgi:hypothetical protein
VLYYSPVKRILLGFSFFAAVVFAADPPVDLAKARADFEQGIDAATTPLREHYLWQLEAARRAAATVSDAAIIKSIDAEISRVGGVRSDRIPAGLVGVWSNDQSTPFQGKSLIVTADGKGLFAGDAGLGTALHWRYISASGALRGTMLMQHDERDLPQPVMTVELHLDVSTNSLAVTAFRSIIKQFGSERNFLRERFVRKSADIPKEFSKRIQ